MEPDSGKDALRSSEVPTDSPFAKAIPERTAATTSAQRPSPPPPAEPVPGPAEPGLEEEVPQMFQEKQLRDSVSAILTQAPDSPTLDGCTSEQQGYIMQYGVDIIRDGNKPEWAAKVCASMVILYQNGISEIIPETVSPLKTVTNISDIKKRAEIKASLSDIMSRYGANYTIISQWLESQQGSSWSQASKAIKYHLLQQHTNVDEIDSRFYLEQHKFKTPKEAIDDLRSNYELFKKGQQFSDECCTQSIAMYKAFTAIVLAKTKVGYIDPAQRICKVVRGDRLESMQKAYPTEPWTRPRGHRGELVFSDKIRGGIADSTALGVAATEFSGPDIVTRTFMMPFSRVMAIYFISPELCCDPKEPASKITKESISVNIKQLKEKYGAEREVTCDFSCLPSTTPSI
jgi:hypothetical protein